MMKSSLLGAVCAVGFIGTANASLINITATSTNLNITDFTLKFDDTGDGLLQIDEVVLFSGFTIIGSGTALNGVYDMIIGTPDIAGISTASGEPLVMGDPGGNWNFTKSIGTTSGCCSSGTWTYSTVVPIPAALWLFGSGLIGLVGIARRKKTA